MPVYDWIIDYIAFINIGLFALLLFATIYYAYQTKKLVRDNPRLSVYAQDPNDYEWNIDVAKVEPGEHPRFRYLRVKALLINPGIVPIVLENFSEKIINDSNEVDIDGRFIVPKISSSERYGLYVFAMPWVTLHDDFSIWYRVYELNDDTDEEYKLKITFNYMVGDKKRSVIKVLNLKLHNP